MRDRCRSGHGLRVRHVLVALLLLLPFVAAARAEPIPLLSLTGPAALGETSEPGGFDPFDLIFLCVPGYFLLQAALTFWTAGGWRKASLVPAVIMVPILAYTVLAFAAQSNLWPLLLLLSAPLALLYLIFLSAILLLRRLAKPA